MRINYIGSRANSERNIEIEAKDKEMELVEKILKAIGWNGEFAWFGSGDMNDGYASVDSRAEYDEFCRDFREARKALKQTVTRYQDKYDSQKIWEVTKSGNEYRLAEIYNGRQFGQAVKVSKEYLKLIGMNENRKIG
jgi:hypothetical protein